MVVKIVANLAADHERAVSDTKIRCNFSMKIRAIFRALTVIYGVSRAINLALRNVSNASFPASCNELARERPNINKIRAVRSNGADFGRSVQNATRWFAIIASCRDLRRSTPRMSPGPADPSLARELRMS
jgi:hypothetical protein